MNLPQPPKTLWIVTAVAHATVAVLHLEKIIRQVVTHQPVNHNNVFGLGVSGFALVMSVVFLCLWHEPKNRTP